MEITELTRHPEQLNRDTLYELRSLLALYPYFQTARLLMLQNLYLLHDPIFDEELRKAAIYITDRNQLFQMVEARHYQLRNAEAGTAHQKAQAPKQNAQSAENRTLSLIDNFLESIPKETETEKRKPTPADAAIDYVAYLLETEGEDSNKSIPQMKGQQLIDTFINNDKGKIELSPVQQYTPPADDPSENDNFATEEGYFTETLARIYIKQGRYLQALEIIQRLSLVYPKKNVYFADQIRFLQKLIINSNKK